MINLIYKEIYLGRKRIILFSVFSFIVAVLGVLIRISLVCGNMKMLPSDSYKSADTMTYYVFCFLPFLIMMFCTIAVIENVSDDYRFNWVSFGNSTQISARNWVTIKYITILLLTFFSFLYGIIYYAIITILAKREIETGIIKGFIILTMIILLFEFFALLLVYIYKNINAVVTIFAVIFSIISISLGTYLIYSMDKFSNAHPEIPDDLVMGRFIMSIIKKFNFEISTILILAGAGIFLVYIMFMFTVRALRMCEEGR